MTYASFQRVEYDRYLNLTSFSLPMGGGELKTWFFAGDHAAVLSAYASPSPESLAILENYIERHYVGHRSLRLKPIHESTHEIELRELNLENVRDPRAMLSFMFDPVLEKVQASEQTVALSVRPEVIESLRTQGYLKPLYSYVMSRELTLNRTNQTLTHEKTGGNMRKFAELKARHMPKVPCEQYPLRLPKFR